MKFIKQKNGVRVWFNEEKGLYTVKGFSTTDKDEALKHLDLLTEHPETAASKEHEDDIITDIKKRDHKFKTLEEVMADPDGAHLVQTIEEYRNLKGFFQGQRQFAIQLLADKFGYEYGR